MTEQQGIWIIGKSSSYKRFIGSIGVSHFLFNNMIICARMVDVAEFVFVESPHGKRCKNCLKMLNTYSDLNNMLESRPPLNSDTGFS